MIPPILVTPSSSPTIGPAYASRSLTTRESAKWSLTRWVEQAELKRWAALIIVAAIAVALTLGSVIVLVGATISISQMTNPAMRALATTAEVLVGMVWLLGTVYIATHLAVLIFGQAGPASS
jgi:hypothetical protein